MSKQSPGLDNQRAELQELRERVRTLEARCEDTAAVERYAASLECKLAALTDHLVGWYWEIDDAGLITKAGRGISLLLGYSEAEVLGQPLSDLFAPDVTLELQQALRTVLVSGEPVSSFVTKRVRKDGSTAWISSSIIPCTEENSELRRHCGVDTDISDRIAYRSYNQELVERLNRYNKVSSEGIIIHENGLIVEANQAFATMTGYSVEELKRLPACKLVPEDSVAALEQFVKEEVEHFFDLVLVRRDGSAFIAEVRSTSYAELDRTAKVLTVRDITARKKAELALRKSEESYRLLFEKAPIGIVLTTLDGNFLHYNNQILKIVGKTADDMSTLTSHDFYKNLPDRHHILAELEATGFVPGIEVEVKRPDHQPMWVRLTITKLQMDGETYTLTLSEDITGAKLMHEALTKSEARYRELFESTLVGIIVFDHHGNIQNANQAAVEILGYTTADELFTKDVAELYVDDRSLRGMLYRLYEHGYAGPCEIKCYRRDGSVISILGSSVAHSDEDGRIISVDGFFTDITAMKLAEANLLERTMLLESMREIDRAILTAQSVFSLIDLTSKYLQKLIHRTGYSISLIALANGEKKIFAFDLGAGPVFPEELGCSFCDAPEYLNHLLEGAVVIQSDLWEKPLNSIDRALVDLGIRTYFEIPLFAQGELLGSLQILDATTEPFTPHEIEIATDFARSLAVALQQTKLLEGIKSYTTNLETMVAQRTKELRARVSEVEELNADLRKTSQNLHMANTELELLTKSLSQTLKEKLRCTASYAGLLKTECSEGLDETGLLYTNLILKNSSLMELLLDKLIEYRRLSPAKQSRYPVNLTTIANKVVSLLQKELALSQAQITIHPALGLVMGAESSLLQVMKFLVTNALKFVAKGIAPKVLIRSELRGNLVRIWVEDNGIGIDPAYFPKLFVLFSRLHTEDEYPGNGVGLAFAKKLIRDLDGSIGLESMPEQGSKFWFELPTAPAP